MEKKTKLRIIQVLCIISILMTFFSIQKTYAKYYEKVDTTYMTTLKRWVINVNNYDIHGLSDLNDKPNSRVVMTPVFVHNDHMNDNNTLVPGREGYFPFVIDYTKVDLIFRYEFDITQLNIKTEVNDITGETITTDEHLDDFEVYGFQLIDGAFTDTIEVENLEEINPVIDPVESASPVKKATIKYKKNGTDVTKELDADKKVEIRVLFRWNDENADTTTSMTNAEDTAFKGEINTDEERTDDLHQILKYNVEIKFIQEF